MALDFITRFVAALHSAGIQPDENVYASGGHGFGMAQQGTESDKWIEEFFRWLGAQEMVP